MERVVRVQIEELLQQIEGKAKLNINKQTAIKCRSFIRKLGYKSRSQKLVDEVAIAVKQSNMQFRLPRNKASWMELSPDENLIFQLRNKEQIIRKNPYEKTTLYAFQAEAIHALHSRLKKGSFKGLLVLPTGGGKTTTAVRWIYEAALQKGKKVLWLAHRHELLNQAFETFNKQCTTEVRYRIVSGVHEHAKQINEEQLLIASKDSLIHHLDRLEEWLEKDDELFVVVDEAHHATSATYKTLLNKLYQIIPKMHLLGLTATPFRTAESEQGALRDLFKDGIFYKKDLKNLVASGVLAEPRFYEMKTEIQHIEKMDDEQLQLLQTMDILPEAVANQLANNKKRNQIIVQQYKNHRAVYGKTILFAINRIHAITLAAVFNQQGVDARIVISNYETTAQNEETIRLFREGIFPVLINVNILTEGADFPDVQTVFLTRPTISSIFMTQMVGRALRGEVAGGTKEAYIVSFVDEWLDKIAWSNPQVLLAGENMDPTYSEELQEKLTTVISAKMIEELALRMNDATDFEQLNRLHFEESVPLGIYSLHYLFNEKDLHEDILVYENDAEAYRKMLEELPRFCAQKGLHKQLSNRQFMTAAYELELNFFIEDQLKPMYDLFDLVALLKYYVATKDCPVLLLFKERKQINISEIARTIMSKDLSYRQQRHFIQKNWDENPFLQLFFSYKELYYKKCVQTELLALEQLDENLLSKYESTIPLGKLKHENHAVWRSLVYQVYEKHRLSTGEFESVQKDFRSSDKSAFAVAYRRSLKNGGQTKLANLALVKKP